VSSKLVSSGDPNLPIYANEIGLPASTPTTTELYSDAQRAATLSLAGDALAHGDCGVDSYDIYSIVGSDTSTTDNLGDGSYFGILDPTTFAPNITGQAIIAAEQRWQTEPAGGLIECGSGITPTQDLLPLQITVTDTNPACIQAEVTYRGNPLQDADVVLLATDNRVDPATTNANGEVSDCVDNNGPNITSFTAYAEVSSPNTTGSLTAPNIAMSATYSCSVNTSVPCTLTSPAPRGGTTPADLTPPVISHVPASITTAATSSAGAVVTYATPTATDAVYGTVPVTCVPASGSTFPIGTTIVTCAAIDPAGNTANATFSVRVTSPPAITPPAITVPANITKAATGPSGASVTYAASATAPSGTTLASFPCAPDSGSTFPVGTTTVTCTATDANGGTASKTFTVTVTDLTPPVIHGVPANITVLQTSASGAVVTYTKPTATDIVSGTVTVTCSPPSGATFPVGVKTVSCSSKDAAGNTATATFTVTVKDTTAPAITVPANITTPATGPSGATVSYSAGFADAYSTITTSGCTPASGATFAIGTTTVTCRASDAAGNTASAIFKVTVTDLARPVISGVPANITRAATSSDGVVVTYASPSATDIVDGTVAVSCAPSSGSRFPIGTTTVTCTATDSAANTARATFKVTVTDLTAPVIRGVPANITRAATSSAGAVVTYTDPTASDIVYGTVPVTCSPPSGSTFADGTTTVTCTATDGAANKATATFTITIAAPTITVPANITAAATGRTGATVSYGVTFTDTYSTITSSNCKPASGTTFAIGTTTVTCTATDKAGATASATFKVTVTDLTAPVIRGVPANITTSSKSAAGAVVTYTDPTATDIVYGTVPVTCAPPSGSTFPNGTTTVICTATDGAGNRATATFTVTVTAPTITVPANITAAATGRTGAIVTYSASAKAASGTTLSAFSCAPASGATFAIGATTVKCSASDANGGAATATFKVTVTDLSVPVIRGVPANITRAATSSAGAVVTYTDPTASDIVSGTVPVTCTPTSGSTFADGTTTVTCTATDGAGNRATATFTVTVAAPTITVPANITAPASGPNGATVSYGVTFADAYSTITSSSCTPASGTRFKIGTTTVTCTATDKAGATASATFKVTVTDLTAPAIRGVPENITAAQTSTTGAMVTYTSPTATDIVDGALPVSCRPASGSTFPPGATTVTCGATDSAGNTATKTFKVTVADTTAPVITVPANITTPATGPAGASVSYTATFSDAYSTLTLDGCRPASGSTFAPGTTAVTCSAADTAGNTATKTFDVTVTGEGPTPSGYSTPSAGGATGSAGTSAANGYRLEVVIVRVRASSVTLRARLLRTATTQSSARMKVWFESADAHKSRLIKTVRLSGGHWRTFAAHAQVQVGDRIVVTVPADAAAGLTALQTNVLATRRLEAR
jgi:hypothetical protein